MVSHHWRLSTPCSNAVWHLFFASVNGFSLTSRPILLVSVRGAFRGLVGLGGEPFRFVFRQSRPVGAHEPAVRVDQTAEGIDIVRILQSDPIRLLDRGLRLAGPCGQLAHGGLQPFGRRLLSDGGRMGAYEREQDEQENERQSADETTTHPNHRPGVLGRSVGVGHVLQTHGRPDAAGSRFRCHGWDVGWGFISDRNHGGEGVLRLVRNVGILHAGTWRQWDRRHGTGVAGRHGRFRTFRRLVVFDACGLWNRRRVCRAFGYGRQRERVLNRGGDCRLGWGSGRRSMLVVILDGSIPCFRLERRSSACAVVWTVSSPEASRASRGRPSTRRTASAGRTG